MTAFLEKLSQYRDIVIQCHDVPDADAIASGFAIHRYFETQGITARLVYSGEAVITKPSLIWMLRLLDIPLERVDRLADCGLLVTVDCQHGAGNVRRFAAPAVAVIDHHRQEIAEGPLVKISPALGSCATLVWQLLKDVRFDFDSHPEIYTALYYGLYTDTNGLAELRHPMDRDLMEFRTVDRTLIRKLKNSALSIEELDLVAKALISAKAVGAIGVLKAQPCDPNILGFACDIAQQVEQFGSCVAYASLQAGLKLSLRSSVREVMANELSAYLTRGLGSGGGNIEKAGGYISYEAIERAAPGLSPDEFLIGRIKSYQNEVDHIWCGQGGPDFSSMPLYRKKRLPLGFVGTLDLFPSGTSLTIRTLEGDIDTVADENLFLMIGASGEVYPIRRDRHVAAYDILADIYRPEPDYCPVVADRLTGEKKSLLPFAKTCVPRADKLIRAQALIRDTKVFTDWDLEKYFHGQAGDYIAAPETDYKDIYIINGDIFGKTYQKIE
jgi:phosphoglycolate phosphatase